MNILRIDASGRHAGSHSRDLIDHLIARLTDGGRQARVVERDLIAAPPPPVDDAWINAAFTPAEQRTPEQRAALRASEALVEELKAADVVVIGCPIYNWGVPAALKAWIDQICRARVTFAYGADGPVGLLENRKTYLVVTSGGTGVGSEADYATGYVRFVLGVIGLKDVELIAADRLMVDAESSLAAARAVIGAMPPFRTDASDAAYVPA